MKKIAIIILLASAVWTGYRTEICIGRVIDDQGNGKEYNGESYYNYIAYPDKYNQDDIILTYFLKNPLNTAEDDYIIRHDIRILKNV